MKVLVAFATAALLSIGTQVSAKDCDLKCYAKDGKTLERTLKWTCSNDKSCSADCSTGKTACADPVTLKPLPGEKDKKQ